MLGWYVWPFREGFSQLPSSPFHVRAVHLLQLSSVAGVEGLAPKVHWNKMPSLIVAEVEGLARLSSPIFRFTVHFISCICLLLLGGRAASSGEVGQAPLNHRFGICIPMPWVGYACGGPSCASLSWVSCKSYSNDSCNVLFLFVVCEVEGPSIHCPSSPFQVYCILLLLRRVGWLFSGSWAMFSQRLPWHLHRFYFSCLCLLAARICQGEKRCKYVPFLCLSLIISCFRVEGLALQEGLGWGGRAAPPSRRRNMSFGNNLLSFGPLSSSWCYRGGGVRALGKVGLPIFSDWPSPTSHFMSCKILYVFAVFDVEGSSLNSPSSLLYVNFVPCANCCCCIGWVGSSREVGQGSLSYCLAMGILLLLVACACCGGQGAFEGQRWVVSVSAGNHHILVDASPPSRLGTDI